MEIRNTNSFCGNLFGEFAPTANSDHLIHVLRWHIAVVNATTYVRGSYAVAAVVLEVIETMSTNAKTAKITDNMMLILHKYQGQIIRIVANGNKDDVSESSTSSGVKDVLSLVVPLIGDVSGLVVRVSGYNSGDTISKVSSVIGRIASIMCDSATGSTKSAEIPKAQTFGDPSKPVNAASAAVSGIASLFGSSKRSEEESQPPAPQPRQTRVSIQENNLPNEEAEARKVLIRDTRSFLALCTILNDEIVERRTVYNDRDTEYSRMELLKGKTEAKIKEAKIREAKIREADIILTRKLEKHITFLDNLCTEYMDDMSEIYADLVRILKRKPQKSS